MTRRRSRRPDPATRPRGGEPGRARPPAVATATADRLRAALEAGEARAVAAALGELARAHGMSDVARASGLGRESLYKALSPGGNPELGTVLRVVAALGLELRLAPKP